MKKKSLLLTGCAGFIGSNFLKMMLADESICEQYDFTIVDALTYSGFYGTIESDIENAYNAQFFELDICDSGMMKKLFSEKKFNRVIHFAAESHVDRSIENPNLFIETNVLGTANLLNASLDLFKIDPEFKFLQISTDEVYGSLKEEDSPFTEKSTINPSSPYSASKASADFLALSYYATFGLPVIVTRCSNNYGPYQFPEKLIPLMISNAMKEIKLPVYGDGRNIRDWIFVDDHNKGVLTCFNDGKSGEIYNLGGDCERRNIDIVRLIVEKFGKSEDLIEFVTDRRGHDWRYAMDFTKAKNELNWEPEIDFEMGIEKTIKWYHDNQDWLEVVGRRA